MQPGSLYGALKRLAAEGLIREVRTEREGNRPERTVYGITTAGRRSLSALHDEALHQIVSSNDPFDLALSLSRDLPGQNLEGVVEDRLSALRAQESSQRHRAERADPYLNEAERMIVLHMVERTVAEVRWHEELLARMPKIIADFSAGIGGVKQTETAGARDARPAGEPGTQGAHRPGAGGRDAVGRPAAGNGRASDARARGTNDGAETGQ